MSITIGDQLWKIFEVDVSKNALYDCISASRALAELKGMVESLPTPDVTRNFISLSESKALFSIAGSEYEKDMVFKASVAKEGSYDEGLLKLIRFADILKEYSAKAPTASNLVEAMSEMTGEPVSIRSGNLERSAIGKNEENIEFASGPNVVPLMTQIFDYIGNDNGTDELIRSTNALLFLHVVHPFDKDEGLAESLFLNMMLNHFGLSDGCEIMAATVLAEHKDEYYDALRHAESEGHTECWTRFILRIIREGAHQAIRYIHSIQETYEETYRNCMSIQFFSKDLVDIVFSNIYCKSQNIIRAGLAERVTAMKYLRTFEELGYLESEKVGRETIFRNVPLHRILMKE